MEKGGSSRPPFLYSPISSPACWILSLRRRPGPTQRRPTAGAAARHRGRPARGQLGMACPVRRTRARIEHDQPVHRRDGRQPVRDRDHGLALPSARTRLAWIAPRPRDRAPRSPRPAPGSARPSGRRARSRCAGAGRPTASRRARRHAPRSPCGRFRSASPSMKPARLGPPRRAPISGLARARAGRRRCCRRIERCSREVSCVTTPMLRAQALLRHVGDALAVDQEMRPPSTS